MKGIFVTGTDTGVGKTVVTACLARYFSEKGARVITQKWVSCGDKKNISADVLTHLRAMGKGISDVRELLPHLSPYVFPVACSPHLASRLARRQASPQARRRVDAGRIKASYRCLAAKFDVVLVEGAGGALVPIDDETFLIDIAQELRLPVLVVVRNRLGAINHALLTTEALRLRKMKILGFIFNNDAATDKRVLEDNPRIAAKLTGVRVMGVLPLVGGRKPTKKLYRDFLPIGRRIFSAMRTI